MMTKCQLIEGDNLDIMKGMDDSSIDLIYADPPFNTGRDWVEYDDFYSWNDNRCREKESLLEWEKNIITAIDNVRGGSMSAYCMFIWARLVEMKRVLKDTGSIYLHCDDTACHYIKIIMDHIFGGGNFRNQIIWKRSDPKPNVKRKFYRSHDVIFWYSRTDKYYFDSLHTEHTEEYLNSFYKYEDENGRYREVDLTSPNSIKFYEFHGHTPKSRGWALPRSEMEELLEKGMIVLPDTKNGQARRKFYLSDSKGVPIADIWSDIRLVSRWSGEKNYYPTQKPIALLNRIVESSCPLNGKVLDPFCGSGTTLESSYNLDRNSIGIDLKIHEITRKRIDNLQPRFF